MTAETYETFTREDSTPCRVAVVGASTTEGGTQSAEVFFLDEPREQLLPDILNQGWYVAEGSKLRYQRGPIDNPEAADPGGEV